VTMYAEERQEWILSVARREGRVNASTVAAELQVTTETVRRDLSILERKGLVRRTHGGALPVERLTSVPDLAGRARLMTTEKDRIAKAALDELPEAGGSVIIDAGTTTARLVAHLPSDLALTVVTSSVPIASALMTATNADVLMVGGRLRKPTQGVIDDWALHALADITVDVAFLATNGVCVDHGLSTPDQRDAAVKRAMVAAARRIVVLGDHSKVGSDYFCRFAELRDIDVLITDSGLDRELAEQIERVGPKVVRA
jgi:DeoR family transcriptional regulator, fructose operon transcriptional repressor